LTRAEDVDAISKELADGLRQLYGPKLRELILYGSWARGDAREDSDIDFLAVLDSVDDYLAELRRVTKISSPITMARNVYVSVQPISLNEYEKGEESFVLNVQKEGRRVA